MEENAKNFSLPSAFTAQRKVLASQTLSAFCDPSKEN
jgi:hypothetical protein